MSHSQFHCTGRAYLDMHGLIFETSICYWQDQPGRSAVSHGRQHTPAFPSVGRPGRPGASGRENAPRVHRVGHGGSGRGGGGDRGTDGGGEWGAARRDPETRPTAAATPSSPTFPARPCGWADPFRPPGGPGRQTEACARRRGAGEGWGRGRTPPPRRSSGPPTGARGGPRARGTGPAGRNRAATAGNPTRRGARETETVRG